MGNIFNTLTRKSTTLDNSELDDLVQQMNTELSKVKHRKHGISSLNKTDGATKTFTVPEKFNASTIQVWNNDTRIFDFTVKGTQVITGTAPILGNTIRFDYDPL